MLSTNPVVRCFGIDWLEYFVNEDPTFDYSPDGFRSRGWIVEERDYGTKTMAQMFKLLDFNMHPAFEVRRMPRGVDDPLKHTVYHPGDSYIRLDNMYCYDANPIELMEYFVKSNHYTFKKIYRIDLYIDLVKFDEGDLPATVAKRIVKHVYAKVNQARRRTAGNDTWEDCKDNWLSWGAAGSMVSTKFYDKSQEVKENKMKKPYVIETWRMAGFIDNVLTISKESSPVDVWRLEFSIRGNAKGWVVISEQESEDGGRYRLAHGPSVYNHPQGVLNAIANLIPYYFKFRIFEQGKKKYDCKEKVLFKFSEKEVELGYRLTSESDIDRVRSVNVSDDMKAADLVWRAATKIAGSSESVTLFNIYQSLLAKVDRKSEMQFSPNSDLIF